MLIYRKIILVKNEMLIHVKVSYEQIISTGTIASKMVYYAK